MLEYLITLILISQGTLGTGGVESILFGEEEYLVGPGDTIEVLLEDLSISYPTFIDFSGRMEIFLPYFKSDSLVLRPYSFKLVYNLSLKELKDSLKIWYGSLIKAGKIDVRVVVPRNMTILVKGNTETNAPVSVRASNRLSSLLSIQDFICGFDADINSILIETQKGDTIIVDLEKYFKFADIANNPLLAKIRSVYVPRIEKGITVYGAIKGYPVKKFKTQIMQAMAGTFQVSFEANVFKIPCNDSLKVEEILTRAGGLRSYALVSEISSAKKGNVTLNDYIKEGDTLYVPPFTDKVFVAGEVKSPGFVPYLPGASLETYISYCGGYTVRAASHRLYVVRGNRKITKKHISNIQPGDIIFVPEVKLKWFEDYLQLAQVITSLVITWLTVSRL